MEAKYLAIFAILVVVVFISGAECTPIPNELEDQANLVDSAAASSANVESSVEVDDSERQDRQYGWGYPYSGYGGYGGLGHYGGIGGGSSSAAAAAAASSSSGGSGYPYGK